MEVKEAARELGVHINTIYSYISLGKIEANKKGKSWDVPKSEVERLKTEQEITPRMIINFYTYVMDKVKSDEAQSMNDIFIMMRKGKEDSNVKEAENRLARIKEKVKEIEMLTEFKEYLEKSRERWYFNVENGYYDMDELVNKSIQPSSKAFEYRATSGFSQNEVNEDK